MGNTLCATQLCAWLWRGCLVLCLGLAKPLVVVGGGLERVREYQIKAVFLFNFAQFVEWPAQAFPSPTAPMTIGLVGENSFGRILPDTLRGEIVKRRPLVFQQFLPEDDFTACHILFIGQSAWPQLAAILERVGKRPVLTVSEAEGFTKVGGMIGFETEGKEVRLVINPEAAQRAELTLSAKLLKLARIVRKEERKAGHGLTP